MIAVYLFVDESKTEVCFSFFLSKNVNGNACNAHCTSSTFQLYKKKGTLIWTIQPKTISICTSNSEHWVIWNILYILCISRVYVNSILEFGMKWKHFVPFLATLNAKTQSSKCKICNIEYEMYYKLFCHLVWCLICNDSWLMTHDSRLVFQTLIQLMVFPGNMLSVSINLVTSICTRCSMFVLFEYFNLINNHIDGKIISIQPKLVNVN